MSVLCRLLGRESSTSKCLRQSRRDLLSMLSQTQLKSRSKKLKQLKCCNRHLSKFKKNLQ